MGSTIIFTHVQWTHFMCLYSYLCYEHAFTNRAEVWGWPEIRITWMIHLLKFEQSKIVWSWLTYGSYKTAYGHRMGLRGRVHMGHMKDCIWEGSLCTRGNSVTSADTGARYVAVAPHCKCPPTPLPTMPKICSMICRGGTSTPLRNLDHTKILLNPLDHCYRVTFANTSNAVLVQERIYIKLSCIVYHLVLNNTIKFYRNFGSNCAGCTRRNRTKRKQLRHSFLRRKCLLKVENFLGKMANSWH